MANNFKESDHPRDEGGKFTSGGGSSGGSGSKKNTISSWKDYESFSNSNKTKEELENTYIDYETAAEFVENTDLDDDKFYKAFSSGESISVAEFEKWQATGKRSKGKSSLPATPDVSIDLDDPKVNEAVKYFKENPGTTSGRNKKLYEAVYKEEMDFDNDETFVKLRAVLKEVDKVKPRSFANDSDLLAFDASVSKRRYDDKFGYLLIEDNHITKEQVVGYYGIEIPGYERLGLDPKKKYYGYRPFDEIAKAAETSNGVPLLLEHAPESADNPTQQRVGSIGTSAVLNAPYLDNAISITVKRGRDAVDTGQAKQLSSSYSFEPDFTPGVWNGIEYDFVIRDIHFNHVALVSKGRAGSDVVVNDSAPEELKTMSDKDKADEVKKEAVADEETKKVDPATGEQNEKITSDSVLEMASQLSEEELGKVVAALTTANDEDKDKKEEKVDDEDKDGEKEEKKEVAMDSAAIFAELDAKNKLLEAAKPFVGLLSDTGGMTLKQVSERLAKELKLTPPKGHEQTAVESFLKGRTVKQTVTLAMDKDPKVKSKAAELIDQTYGG